MPSRFRPRFRGPLLVAAVFISALAGCSSDRPGRGGPPQKPPTPLAGEETFFEGGIVASVRVGGGPATPRGQRNAGGSERSLGDRLHGDVDVSGNNQGINGGANVGYDVTDNTSIGMGTGGAGVSFGGGGGGGRRGGPRGGGGGGGGPGGGMGAMGPMRMIYLTFTNTTGQPIELLIRDFFSPLGNFAVQPEKITLAPGTSVAVEPMASRLQGDFLEVDATLALRIGTQLERKVVKLRPLPQEATGTPPAK